MAHQLGGMFGIPHGCANAILMPNIIRYNAKATDKGKEYLNSSKKKCEQETCSHFNFKSESIILQ